MDEGLDSCTHFLVLLTENSIGRRWVQAEIDAGFMGAVEGKARFIGVLHGIEAERLPPLLKTRLWLRVDPSNPADVETLVAHILRISQKPQLGSLPSYVKAPPAALERWSPAARTVAEHLVRSSKNGLKFDPQTDPERVAAETGLPIGEVRLGKMELQDWALVEETKTIGEESFWPLEPLFVEFDRHILDFDNEKDAAAIAARLVNEDVRQIEMRELATRYPDWAPRRINSAIAYLYHNNAVRRFDAMGTAPYVTYAVAVTDRTRLFVRDHS
jgi:hypothetical protein